MKKFFLLISMIYLAFFFCYSNVEASSVESKASIRLVTEAENDINFDDDIDLNVYLGASDDEENLEHKNLQGRLPDTGQRKKVILPLLGILFVSVAILSMYSKYLRKDR